MKQIPRLKLSINRNRKGNAVIDIDGEIGGAKYDGEEYSFNTTPAVKKKLREISDVDAGKIIVNINSPGGFVNDGLAIHDALAQHPARIVTKVYGMTASAATIIAQAGDEREMSRNALYLIHRAWGMALGNQNDMRDMIETLDKIDNRIAGIYARRAGRESDYFLDLMNENDGGGRFLDSIEAKEFGLIDSEFEPMKAAASINSNILNAMGITLPEDSSLNVTPVTEDQKRARAIRKMKL
ncbi:ATP-dependent protease ClpP, protease subunit [Fodinibius roseus]|uniref:ATP-dependent Clp protease proteolytic subunit n=1 Tax=Fodinibius roseus TaxID=1194090 RepID=A0A1M4UQY9_9BACT|nr:head maturation protease, ClpP-related [Fodinibius roseus]SHE59114.1 ATP-dependent protease ClpP, protease subunit [Fodinibius roseus]